MTTIVMEYYACPQCGTTFHKAGIVSFFSRGYSRYSDGSDNNFGSFGVVGLLPYYGCRQCKYIGKKDTFLKIDKRPAGEPDGTLDPLEVTKALLEDATTDPNDRPSLLMQYLWLVNNGYHFREYIREPDTPRYREYLNELIRLHKTSKKEDIVFIAELFRERGHFSKCIGILDALGTESLDPELELVARQIRTHAKEGNREVFVVRETVNVKDPL